MTLPGAVRFAPCILGFAALLVASSALAQTDYISVNFEGGNANGAPTSMNAGDVAGVWAQPNWYNAPGKTGTLNNLYDCQGNATNVGISYSADGLWGSNTGTGSANAKMMNGYLDGGYNGGGPDDLNTITFSGLPPGSLVSVIAYNQGDTGGRSAEYSIPSDPRQPTYYQTSTNPGDFATNGFVQTTSTTPGTYTVGNYEEWSSVLVNSLGQVVITGQADQVGSTGQPINPRSSFNGVQLQETLPSTSTGTLTWNGGGGSNAPADGGGTWDNGITGNWWSAASSGASTWSDSSAAVFGAANGSAGTVTISGSVAPNSLSFLPSGDGSTYTLSGGTIDLNGAARTINCAVNATLASTLIDSTRTIGGVTKTGEGRLTLTASNSFPGPVVFNAGTIAVPFVAVSGQNSPLGAGTSLVFAGGTLEYTGNDAAPATDRTVALNGSGTFQVDNAGTTLTLSGPIAGSGSLTKSGPGGLVLGNPSNSFTGPVTLSQGVIAVASVANGSQNSPLGAGASLVFDGGALEYTGVDSAPATDRGVTLTANGGTIQVDNASTSLTLNGVLAGAGGLTKLGPGTLTLAANSTYSGGTTVSGGTLSSTTSSGATALGTGNVTVNVGGTLSGGTLDAFGYGAGASPALITIAGGTVTTAAGGAFHVALPNITFNGGGTLSSDPGNAGDTYGTLSLCAQSAGTATVSVINPGATTALINAGSIGMEEPVTIFDVAAGSAASQLTISSVLQDVSQPSAPVQPSALVKNGSGTMVLSGSNTYSGGTTLNKGTLVAANGLFAGCSATGSGTLTLNGGTLASDPIAGGAIANVLAGLGSHSIAPGGIGAVGQLNVGNLTLNNYSTLDFDIGSGGADLLDVSGTLAFTSGSPVNVVLSVSQNATLSASYTLATWGSGTVSNANFNPAGVPKGYMVEVVGKNLELVSSGPSVGIWSTSAAGLNWSNGTAWCNTSGSTLAAPNGVDAQAVVGTGFSDGGTTPPPPQTIRLDSAVTLGKLTLQNPQHVNGTGYVLAADANNDPLIMAASSGAASIVVLSASHTISAPVVINSSLSSAGTLSIQLMPDNTLSGALTGLTMSGPIGDGSVGNGVLSLDDGTGTLVLASSDNSYGGGTYVNAGTLVATATDAIPAGTSLSVAAGATFIYDPSRAPGFQAGSVLVAAAVPEPCTLALLGAGLAAAALAWRRKKNFV